MTDMSVHTSIPRTCAAIALATTVALVAACAGGSSNSGGSTGSVTLTWWHNATTEPGKSVWQQVADAYHAAHPTVSFKIEPIQNEQFPTKVPLALQSNNPPHIYQQWGGGAEATQIRSGRLMDMTQAVSGWIGELGNAAKGWQVDGRQYGVPFDLHVVGFWYRKDLFAQAGITAPPATMDELNADVAKLKAAGIPAVAIGSKDKWPDAFWWEYFVLRECSNDTVKKALAALRTEDACFLKAGADLQAFLATKPFQNAFLGTPAQQGAGSSAGLVANGKAAMELQGDWELPTMIPLTSDKDFASKLGWFPFPSVSGGAGEPGTALGGGDGFSCTSKATAACPDFLKYITIVEVQTKLVQTSTATLPANPGANSAISDPSLKTCLQYLQSTPYLQLYFDQALPTSVGQALNDAIANFFAGQGTPESIARSVAKAAANQ
jgi:raffinose/stachyose/melibiose transport system substrate-binding protein